MRGLNLKTATRKFGVFSKAFVQLTCESQDKLVKVAHRLLKTHKLAKRENAKHKEGSK